MDNKQEQVREKDEANFDVRAAVDTVSKTATGASIGVIGAVACVTAAAVVEVVLPVAICLWACGVAGGAIGLSLGIKKKKK